jgi:hypothetical protein
MAHLKFFSNWSRPDGFGIVQIMMAIAIASVAAASMAQLLSMMATETKRANARSEFSELESLMAGYMSNVVSCRKMFGVGSNLSGIRTVVATDAKTAVPIELFEPTGGASVVKAGSQYGRLTVDHVFIKEADLLSTDALGNSTFLVKIELAAGTDRFFFRPANFVTPIVVDSLDKFQYCDIDGGILVKVCTSMGGVVDSFGTCDLDGEIGDGVAIVADGSDYCGGNAIFCLGGTGGTGSKGYPLGLTPVRWKNSRWTGREGQGSAPYAGACTKVLCAR